MAQQFTIPKIIQFAQISQYLASNERASLTQLKSGSLITILPELLYMEGALLQNMYNLNPTGSTLRGTAEWVLSLCGKYLTQAYNILNNLAGAFPIITGPNSQNVNVGQTATFSVTLVSGGPATYQWLLNNVPIPGATTATLPIINAQLSQSGGLYSVAVTNSAGTIVSNQATLTVTANILLSAYYSNTDPSTNINNQIDNFAYQFTVNVTHNQPITIPIPQAAANNMWWVWRVAATEQVDNTWFNTPTNNGQIPDSVFQTPASFGGNTYYYLRNATSFDYTQNLILSKL